MINQLCHILWDFKEGKFNEDDIKEHVDTFINRFPEAERKKLSGELKYYLQRLYSISHSQFVDQFLKENKLPDKEDQTYEPILMTIKEVCDYLKISKPTYYAMKKRGLKTKRVGGRVYIDKFDLLNFADVNIKGFDSI